MDGPKINMISEALSKLVEKNNQYILMNLIWIMEGQYLKNKINRKEGRERKR